MTEEKQFEFQIIAGSLKGRRIVAPDLGITRPPLTRLRKSIFDYLSPYILEAHYLDLFSGTGSYLFEAVSRGATSATGVEMEEQLAESINRQAERYNVSKLLECRCQNVFEAVPGLHADRRRFDIIMIAPPQYKGFIARTLNLLKDHALLEPDGQIICQHDSSETKKTDWNAWQIRQHRKYGNTTYTILGQPES